MEKLAYSEIKSKSLMQDNFTAVSPVCVDAKYWGWEL